MKPPKQHTTFSKKLSIHSRHIIGIVELSFTVNLYVSKVLLCCCISTWVKVHVRWRLACRARFLRVAPVWDLEVWRSAWTKDDGMLAV